MRSFLFALSIFLAALDLAAAQARIASSFQFRFTEPFGTYSVGLRVEKLSDPSRPFQAAPLPEPPVPRPLQTLIWYPAQSTPRQSMTLGEYGAFVKTETTTVPQVQGKSQDHIAQFTHGLEDLPMRAVRDAVPEAGSFPILLYAPSLNATNTENIELCEYLASHGYIVLASPSLGATDRRMTTDQAGVDAQAQDIVTVLHFAMSLADADPSEIAVSGFSWGGNAALFAAAHDKAIRAIVGFDPSFLESGNPVPQADFTIPLLVFSHGEEPLAFRDSSKQTETSDVLMRWMKGDLVHVEMLSMAHLSFSSLYERSDRFRAEALQFTPTGYSLEEGAESYNWMVLYTLQFLDAYLKHRPAAQAFLKRTPFANGVPPHLFSIDFRPASRPPPAR